MAMKKRTTKKAPAKKTVTRKAAAKNTVDMPVSVQVYKNYTVEGALVEAEDGDSEVIAVRSFGAGVPVAHVSVTSGITKNIGDFESARISIMVSVPTYSEELDDAHAFATNKAAEYLENHLESIADLVVEDKSEASEDDEEDEDEELDITEADIKKLRKPGLVKLIEEHELELDPDDYDKVAELKEAIIDELFGDDEDEEDEDDDEYDEEEDEDDEDDDQDDEEDEDDDDEDDDDEDDYDDDNYTREELSSAKESELKEVFKAWELGAYPKGKSIKDRKKKAIAKILKAQEEE